MTEPVIVTATDCQKSGFCAPGIWSWCKTHGVDIRDFIKNGLPAERVVQIGDAFGLRALAAAERRLANGRR